MLVKLINGSVARYPYTERDLKADWPQTTFPADLSRANLSDFDAAWVVEVPAPLVAWNENLIEDYPRQIDSVWTQRWRVEAASSSEIAERTASQWSDVRSDRNARLASCDWTQLPDAPVDAAVWASYRQALRDITNQSDPFAIDWPVPPA